MICRLFFFLVMLLKNCRIFWVFVEIIFVKFLLIVFLLLLWVVVFIVLMIDSFCDFVLISWYSFFINVMFCVWMVIIFLWVGVIVWDNVILVDDYFVDFMEVDRRFFKRVSILCKCCFRYLVFLLFRVLMIRIWGVELMFLVVLLLKYIEMLYLVKVFKFEKVVLCIDFFLCVDVYSRLLIMVGVFR